MYRAHLESYGYLEPEINIYQRQIERWTHLYIWLMETGGRKETQQNVKALILHDKHHIQMLHNTREAMEASIDDLPDERHRELLRLRYIELMTFDEIAEAMNYCPRHIMKLHKKGMDKWTARNGC